MKLDLSTVVKRAQSGDTEAFGQLVHRFQDMAVGYAYHRLGDAHLAEDAAQDAFLAAYQALDQLREPAAFPGWIRSAVHNGCERIRRKRRVELSMDDLNAAVDRNNPSTGFEREEQRARVRDAISELPEEERVAITLFYMGNCSHQQIAAFLDLPVATVNNRLRSARTRLAKGIRNPTRSFLRSQAPPLTFATEVNKMIQPIEFATTTVEELPGGYTSTSTEIWQMFNACRAGNLDSVRHLVERCPGLINCEYNYTPPIHFAVREGHLELVRYLVGHGVDPTYRTYRFNDSLLQMAQEREYRGIATLLEELLAGRFPHSPTVDELLEQAGSGDVDRVRELLDADAGLVRASNETGDTALHRACAGGHTGVVGLLLDRGADPEVVRSDGFKPIHSAIRGGYILLHDPPVDPLRAGRCASLLLEKGATYNIFLAAVFGDTPAVKKWLDDDPMLANFEDTHHHRPLSAAAWRQDVDMVSLLLDHGGDPSLPEAGCPRGQALWIAAFLDTVQRNLKTVEGSVGRLLVADHHRSLEIAKLLLEHGADPEASAESGGRAVEQARDSPELYELLVAHGAEVDESPGDRLRHAVDDDNLEAAEQILSQHPDIANDHSLFFGEGILAVPAKRANWSMIDLLRTHGATVPDVTKWGPSYYLLRTEVAKYLLENGMNPNQKNWHGITLLHDMAHHGWVEKARLLIDHGADIDAIDEEYRSTPLGLAARAGCLEMVTLLLERGADPAAAGAAWATPLAWASKCGHQEVTTLIEQFADS